MSRVLLATRNAKKMVELQRILDSALGTGSVELVSLDNVPSYVEAPESGLTFEANALIKAREGARHTGLPTVADDSGLAVDAMGGMPGVFSARWSGRHGDDQANLDLVLAQVADVPDDLRGAAYICAAGTASATIRSSWPMVRPAPTLSSTQPRRTRSATGARRSARWPASWRLHCPHWTVRRSRACQTGASWVPVVHHSTPPL